jgi:hypothetical protein
MSKRCKLQKEYYQQYGNYKGEGKYRDEYVRWLESEVLVLCQRAVSGSLTPLEESIKLLRDLADLQNGAPLEQHRQEWEETMEQVYEFLNRWEGQ